MDNSIMLQRHLASYQKDQYYTEVSGIYLTDIHEDFSPIAIPCTVTYSPTAGMVLFHMPYTFSQKFVCKNPQLRSDESAIKINHMG